MCDPVTAGLILTAGAGMGSTALNVRNANKQDSIAAAGIRKNADSQAEANRRVLEQVNDIAQNTGEQERTASLEDFQRALRAGRDRTEGSLQPQIGANPRFAESVSAGKTDLRKRGDELAERLSIIDGILRQRMNENLDVGRTRSDLNAIGANISADDFLTRLRIQGQQVNPWVAGLLDVAKGVGSGLAMKAPGGAATGAPKIVGTNAPFGGAGAVNPFFKPSYAGAL